VQTKYIGEDRFDYILVTAYQPNRIGSMFDLDPALPMTNGCRGSCLHVRKRFTTWKNSPRRIMLHRLPLRLGLEFD